ncbi:hypothetical protein E1295_41210 [Nonomuraea mesophila]|uniref:DUF5709 domain-containing protein n=2 Tax=Nonomuraea mesophila TaxID=2530382 RepID=A0A4R5EB80_9ACTN|nr:hypothetical protein E1295_41210 [Nonomuraea mesophila]
MDIRGDETYEAEDERSIETPEADAAEQQREIRPVGRLRSELPLDVDPADAADQDRVVELDDDDGYR